MNIGFLPDEETSNQIDDILGSESTDMEECAATQLREGTTVISIALTGPSNSSGSAVFDLDLEDTEMEDDGDNSGRVIDVALTVGPRWVQFEDNVQSMEPEMEQDDIFIMIIWKGSKMRTRMVLRKLCTVYPKARNKRESQIGHLCTLNQDMVRRRA
jgi:hypothetical protein